MLLVLFVGRPVRLPHVFLCIHIKAAQFCDLPDLHKNAASALASQLGMEQIQDLMLSLATP